MGKGQVGSRGCHQSPRETEQQEMASLMFAIEDGAVAKDTEEGGINRRRGLSLRGGEEHEPQAGSVTDAR